MSVQDNIRALREAKAWSQEEMAERLNMSVNGYAKIERGETRLRLDKLEQIAQLFDIDIQALFIKREKEILFILNETANNHNYHGNYYADHTSAQLEIDKLTLMVEHRDEIIMQKNQEIAALKEVIALLKEKISSLTS